MPELVSNSNEQPKFIAPQDPDELMVRDAIYVFVEERIPKPNTKFKVIDIDGIEHQLFGEDIEIERIGDEPRANLINKSNRLIVGAGFTLGALFIAVSLTKLFLRDRPKT
jgi:hypothetical protein